MSRTILFLYGTLKRGQSAAVKLAGQEFLREAETLPLYRVYHCGWHPGLVAAPENGVSVKGELWAVDETTLARLDEYEDVPRLFTRESVAVRDCTEDVQAYIYRGPLSADALWSDRWPFPV